VTGGSRNPRHGRGARFLVLPVNISIIFFNLLTPFLRDMANPIHHADLSAGAYVARQITWAPMNIHYLSQCLAVR
jgi:hypothetical protein